MIVYLCPIKQVKIMKKIDLNRFTPEQQTQIRVWAGVRFNISNRTFYRYQATGWPEHLWALIKEYTDNLPVLS